MGCIPRDILMEEPAASRHMSTPPPHLLRPIFLLFINTTGEQSPKSVQLTELYEVPTLTRRRPWLPTSTSFPHPRGWYPSRLYSLIAVPC